MRYLITFPFLMCVIIVNVCLIMPMFDRGAKWEEALVGIVPGTVIGVVMALLIVKNVGLRHLIDARTGERVKTPVVLFWSVMLVWSLAVGTLVLVVNYQRLDADRALARSFVPLEEKLPRMGNLPHEVLTWDYNMHAARAEDDEIGIAIGCGVLAFAAFPAIGLARCKRQQVPA